MRIISEAKLREFWSIQRGAEQKRRETPLREWITVVRKANWNNFSDVRKTFNHADVFGGCTIFDIGGNKYRIIAKVAYGIRVVFVRFVMAHSEYDEANWKNDCK